MDDEIMNKHIFTCKKLASKLAKSKAKLELLTCGTDTDLFSSLKIFVKLLKKCDNFNSYSNIFK